MKLNKSAYLFAAALVASTMGMTSCSSEEFIDGADAGTENTVTLSMSVADKFGTRVSANAVNLGTELSDIENIWVVPTIAGVPQNPISMGSLDPNDKSAQSVEKKTTLNSRVDGFKIYGNVTPDAGFTFNENAVAQNFTVTVAKAKDINGVPVYNPHGLYYYGVANVGEQQVGDPVGLGNIYVGANSGSTTVLTTGSIEKNAYVKIDGVDYAVGVLAAAILNGDESTPVYSSNDGTDTEDGKAFDNITVSGIIINNQKLKLDQDFKPVDGNVGAIYETATASAFVTKGNEIGKQNTGNGNLYVVVTETGTEENVSANIEFTLAANKYIKVGNGKYIGGKTETKFYLPVSLKPEDSKAVFMKDYSTFLNATVKNWGMASETPVEVTDVNLAVEIDLNWREGITYNQDI